MKTFTLSLNELVIKLNNVYDQVRKIPNDYGCGVIIHLSEIHIIEMIGNYPDANTTRLAEILGVTKGLVSRVSSKLEKKGLINKYQYEDNKKEIYYELTELGKIAYQGHIDYHEHNHQQIFERFENYSDEQKEIVNNFLGEYIDYLKEVVDKFDNNEGMQSSMVGQSVKSKQ
jgi:DNA-binding MarR family transcriptional regulator